MAELLSSTSNVAVTISLPPDDKYLRRRELVSTFNLVGIPMKHATLDTLAVRGGGPPMVYFGRIPLYRWGDAFAWAKSRMTPPQYSTSRVA